ncbi:ovostatin-like, partial [Stegodyphus dumicola]|uniref:ovostatin-like n=1 Tax=Stegodyphus dumicola TaxID=202533 RepID=UPI0015AEEC01
MNGGFILTSPKILEAGKTVYFTLSVFDGPPGAEVTIGLLRNATNILAESKVKVLSNQNMWVEMFVPPIDVIRAKVHIFGHFNNGYSINRIGDVRIVPSFNITLIQTDKPLYRPGQTVRFRVLRMDSDLKTLENDA